MVIILTKSDLPKKVCELDAYHRIQFQMLCKDVLGNEKVFKVLAKHSVADLRKVNGLGLDRFLAVPGEIR